MRISTSQIYDAGALSIQNGQSNLFKLQNQLSTGRRVLTPQDDPVASAHALVVTQTMAVNTQSMNNQSAANSQLGLVDSQLAGLTDVLQSVRERVVQAGNTTYSQSNRESMAFELESRLNEIIGIANSDNGVGEYLFSGYSGNVKPFSINAALPASSPATTSPVTYSGDDGERLLQVSSSRQMAISVAGSDVFMNAKNGNGTFVTATGGNLASDLSALGFTPPSAGNNKGSATIDAGSVLDQGKWNAVGNPSDFMVRFTVTAAGGTTYQLYNNTNPAAPVALLAAPQPYTSGQAIKLQDTAIPPAFDYGVQFTVQGQPSDGDSLTVAPSTNQSLFQTMQNLIGILRTPVGSSTYTTTQFSNDLSAQLTNLDQSLNNILRVQATVGTRMQELESLGNLSSDLDVQYKSTLSDLQDVDYAKTISEYIQQNTNLEAAQKSFVQISGLSLFNYM